MAETMKPFLQRWLITTLAVLVAANIVHGIDYDTVAGLLVASFLLGILNAFVRPVMMLLSLPLLIVTLGLFTFVINAVLLYLVGWLVESFHVRTFSAAFWGALVISFVSLIMNVFLGKAKIEVRNPPNPSNRSNRSHGSNDDDDGPIIDV